MTALIGVVIVLVLLGCLLLIPLGLPGLWLMILVVLGLVLLGLAVRPGPAAFAVFHSAAVNNVGMALEEGAPGLLIAPSDTLDQFFVAGRRVGAIGP